MSGESFGQRVRQLRDSWNERREARGVARAHDFESQFELLGTLHRWAEEAVSEIQGVYGDAIRVSLTPDQLDAGSAAFTAFLGDSFGLTFSLDERRRLGASRWFISASVGSRAVDRGQAAAAPERRTGLWTRKRLEELFLTILGAYERSQTDRDMETGRENVRARRA